jgi:hypothetical protein
MRRILACTLTIALFFVSSVWCPAAEQAAATGYVPSDAMAVVVVRVQKIMESKLLEPVFKEEMIAQQIKQAPFDQRQIEQGVIAAVPGKGEQIVGEGTSGVVVIRFTEPTDGKDFISKFAPSGRVNFEQRKHEGKTYYAAQSVTFLFQPDAKTVVLASQEETIKGMISGATGKGPIAEKLKAAGTEDDVVAVVLLEPLRDLIKKAQAGIPPQAKATPAVAELIALPDQIKSVTLTVNLSSPTLAKLALECLSAESSQKVNDTLIKALEGVKPLAGMAVMMARTSPDTPQAAKDAMDVGLRFLQGIKLAPAGDQVVVTVAKPKGLEKFVATVPQMIAEARGQAQDAARRAMRLNNLKQIALAMLMNENMNNCFPSNICDKQGKPLLSWRVAILPYLEEKALYDQFRLDEPWDSPNNKKLLDRMPAIYQGQRAEKDGKTTVMVFAGKNTPFEEGKKTAVRDLINGATNTIMAVEAGPDKAVPWTKPEDLPFDTNDPKAALGNVSPQGFLAVMFDCSQKTFLSGVSAETLRRMINHRGPPVDPIEAQEPPQPKAPLSPGLRGSTRDKLKSAPQFEKY